MDNLNLILTTLFVVENMLLIAALFIWLNRKCQTCAKVKCLERIFNKTCQSCQEKENKPNKKFRF